LKSTGEKLVINVYLMRKLMKLVYAVSQLTEAKRPNARHIDNGEGKPLCGGNGREPFFWAPAQGQPSCKICMDLALMIDSEPEKVNAKPTGGE
jgi:hypothetical protein